MKDDAVYLRHISESIRRIQDYSAEGREAFLGSSLIQDVTLRNLQTLCEATQRLSAELKAKHGEVEWRRIAAFRNVLTHNYLGIDLELVWGVMQRDLIELKSSIELMLASEA